MKEHFVWKVTGKTGEGIESTGELFALLCKEAGLEVSTFRDFPSVIKGGNSAFEVSVGYDSAPAGDTVDLFIALDKDGLSRYQVDVSEQTLLIYDTNLKLDTLPKAKDCYGIDLEKMAADLGSKIMRNMIALGISVYLLSLDIRMAKKMVYDRFAKKSEKIAVQNTTAIEAGWNYAAEHMDHIRSFAFQSRVKEKRMFLSGNEAMSFGALVAGCRLYASYPITPATDIMEWLAARLPRYGGAVIQTEDEIAALCTVIGANYAGVRAMTATSGPGISLMTEAFGLTGMSEVPTVIVNVQRPGPSAGMPTKHEQSDIKHVVYAAHGDMPRIVLAPGTTEECFTMIQEAFNLAEKYQCPVFVTTDQDLAIRNQTVPYFNLEAIKINRGSRLSEAELASLDQRSYERYSNTASGISPRSIPGDPNAIHLASGDEHDHRGRIDVELPEVRKSAMDKRMRKIEGVLNDFSGIARYGSTTAKIVLVGIGSITGVALEACRRLEKEGLTTQYVQLRSLWPLPASDVQKIVDQSTCTIVIENNYSGQLLHLIKSMVNGHEKIRSIRKYDGVPFKPGQLIAMIKEEIGYVKL